MYIITELSKYKEYILENNLTESKLQSFYDVKEEDVISEKYLEEMTHEDVFSHYVDSYIYDKKLDYLDVDNNEIEESEEYKEYFTDILKNNYQEVWENIYERINDTDNTITLYRAIKVNENWFKNLDKPQKRNMGIWWSWDKNACDTHWAQSQPNTVIITTIIEENKVNWIESLRANIHPNYQEEKEIQLYEGTKIKISAIEFDGDDENISHIKNKMFTI